MNADSRSPSSPRNDIFLSAGVYLQSSAVALLFGLAGCTAVGPQYTRPDVAQPQAFRFQESEARDLANVAWWKQFNDPVLDGLIDEALRNNRDLRVAAARRLRRSRAAAGPASAWSSRAR